MNEHFIQYRDDNIGPSAFANCGTDKLMISSVWYTVQGEGPFAGWPAVFVRLAGCNRGDKATMGCRFCDTDFRMAMATMMSFEQIHNAMSETLGAGGKQVLVVVTGGEPMMQNNVSAFCNFLHTMRWPIIQVESNGDRLAPSFPRTPWLQLVVSPKVTKAGYRYLNEDVIGRANFIKFLVEAVPGSPYYMPPDWAAKVQQPVYLSPITPYLREAPAQGGASAWDFRTIDHRQAQANHRHAAGLAMQYQFRLSMQQHLFFQVR